MNKNNNISASFLHSATPCNATTPSRFATRPITPTVKRLVASILALTLTLILTATLLGQPMQQAYADEFENYENPFGPYLVRISDLDGNLIIDTNGNGSGSVDINTMRRGVVIESYFVPVGTAGEGLSDATRIPNFLTKANTYAETRTFIKNNRTYWATIYMRQTITDIPVKPNMQYHYFRALIDRSDSSGVHYNPQFTTTLYFVVSGNGTGSDDTGLNNSIGPDLTSSLSNLSETWLPEGFAPNADATRYININSNSGLPDTTFGTQHATALESINATTGTSNIANQFASGKLFTVKGAPTDELLNPVENPQINATDLVILGLPYLYVALSVVLAACLPAGLLMRFVMFKHGLVRGGKRN